MRFLPLLASVLVVLSAPSLARAQRLNAPELPTPRADEAPPAAIDEPEPLAPGDALLEITTDDPDVELRVPAGTHLERQQGITFRHVEYSRLVRKPTFEARCTGSCKLHVSPGTYRLALGKAGEDSVEGDAPVEINGPSAVHGELIDHSALRTLGKAIAVVTGVSVICLAAAGSSARDGSSETTYFEAGLVTLGVGGTLAAILMLQSDHAHFTVTPLLGGPAGAREGMLPRGAAFTYVF